MKKYLTLFQLSWQNGLAYPLSFALWRVRQLLATMMSLTIWTLIFNHQTQAFGYDRSQMISYIFIVTLLQGAILATSLHSLAGDLYAGHLNQLFIKPISLFKYAATQEVADKLKNVIFIGLEMGLFYLILRPAFVLPSVTILLLFLAWVILAVVLHFYIEILFGSLGFWSPQIWAPKFIFFVLVDVTAGKLFPLDVLPQWLQTMLEFTPFPYLAYVQTQLFLGRLDPSEMLRYSVVLIGWTVGLGWLAKTVWHKGMRSYSAAGG